MSDVSTEQVRLFLLERFNNTFSAMGISPQNVPDDFDLLTEGIIDSFGIVELISDMEDKFHLEIDFGDLDPENLTIIGPFSRFVAEFASRRSN
jgi:acyl carrier protein